MAHKALADTSIAIGVYPGELWRDRASLRLVKVVRVDRSYVHISAQRNSRVHIDNFLQRFDKVAHSGI